ncbi:hypothetical protein DES53_11285 [Roseimicrobium gellanilyticum]|uniref:Uncharacterized protein n=1 Tax=Roseimicrobium gellanilyticum TaxID=748857 RepID=A0A366HAA7_9BACT|nr:hypothetical protein DES53_11285 [Roseimicrobium gellanilyticum]
MVVSRLGNMRGGLAFLVAHRARFKEAPANFKVLTPEENEQCKNRPDESPWLPRQEPGVRPSCSLPYQLYADGALDSARE